MAMRLGDPFPAITADATAGGTHVLTGPLDLHEYWGDGWGIYIRLLQTDIQTV